MVARAPKQAADTGEMGDTIAGEVVTLDAVKPSAEEQKADAKGRISNTAQQTLIPTAIVTIATWLLALCHVDLDPGPGTDMPAVVASAFTSVLAVGFSWRMNRAGLRAVLTELDDYREKFAGLEQLAQDAA